MSTAAAKNATMPTVLSKDLPEELADLTPDELYILNKFDLLREDGENPVYILTDVPREEWLSHCQKAADFLLNIDNETDEGTRISGLPMIVHKKVLARNQFETNGPLFWCVVFTIVAMRPDLTLVYDSHEAIVADIAERQRRNDAGDFSRGYVRTIYIALSSFTDEPYTAPDITACITRLYGYWFTLSLEAVTGSDAGAGAGGAGGAGAAGGLEGSGVRTDVAAGFIAEASVGSEFWFFVGLIQNTGLFTIEWTIKVSSDPKCAVARIVLEQGTKDGADFRIERHGSTLRITFNESRVLDMYKAAYKAEANRLRNEADRVRRAAEDAALRAEMDVARAATAAHRRKEALRRGDDAGARAAHTEEVSFLEASQTADVESATHRDLSDGLELRATVSESQALVCGRHSSGILSGKLKASPVFPVRALSDRQRPPPPPADTSDEGKTGGGAGGHVNRTVPRRAGPRLRASHVPGAVLLGQNYYPRDDMDE